MSGTTTIYGISYPTLGDAADITEVGTLAANVDTVLSQLDNSAALKQRVRAVNIANVSISSLPTTMDGVTMSSGNLFLNTGQSTASQNGLWSYTTSGSAATRPVGFTTGSGIGAVVPGHLVVGGAEGTNNGGLCFNTNTTSITIGSTALTYAKMGTAGAINLAGGLSFQPTASTLPVGTTYFATDVEGFGILYEQIGGSWTRIAPAPVTNLGGTASLRNLPWFGRPYVYSGAALTTGSGLVPTVGLGVFVIEGIPQSLSGTVPACTASTTNYIWCQLQGTAPDYTGLAHVVNTTGTAPAGNASVLVGVAVAGSSTITSVTPSYRGIIAPGKTVQLVESSTTQSPSSGVTSTVALGATALAYDAGTPIKLTYYDPKINVTGTTVPIDAYIFDGASQIADSGYIFYGNGSLVQTPVYVEHSAYTPTAGVRTFQPQIQITGTSPQAGRGTQDKGQFKVCWDF